MPTKIIREPAHIEALVNLLKDRKLPITVSWTQGAPQSDAQRRLSHRWFTDIARQVGDRDREEVRAECKLVFGIPILRADNEAFRIVYDRRFKSLSYEEKVYEIRVLDIPVTRLMTLKQMRAFMDAMQRHWTQQGIRLTDPKALEYEQEFGPVV